MSLKTITFHNISFSIIQKLKTNNKFIRFLKYLKYISITSFYNNIGSNFLNDVM